MKSDTKNLKALGTKTTYPKKPNVKILETFENQHDTKLYLVPFVCEEFTSLCPKTGQPDFAKLEIIYVPRKKMVESKSLKLYLFSFRNQGEFHEDVINRITNDLKSILDPFYIRVYGDFNVRGGIAIKPLVEWYDLNLQRKNEGQYLDIDMSAVHRYIVNELVPTWDRIK